MRIKGVVMKKGFTLIELLAVITLLGILAVFAYPKVTDAIAASKESAYNETVNGIIHAAELYAAANNLGYPTIDTKLDLATLKEADLLNDKDIINPKNNDVMIGCIIYKWANNNYSFRYSEGNECQ